MGAGGREGLEPIQDRAYRFALRVVRLVQAMPRDTASVVLGRQLLRAATSVGANVEEAIGAAGKRDLTNKMTVAPKEARETHYWLRLICDAELVDSSRVAPIAQEGLEIKKILSATVRTAGQNPDP